MNYKQAVESQTLGTKQSQRNVDLDEVMMSYSSKKKLYGKDKLQSSELSKKRMFKTSTRNTKVTVSKAALTQKSSQESIAELDERKPFS